MTITRAQLRTMTLTALVAVVATATTDALAQGCAMCGSAVGEDTPLAGALNVSILFMLATPYVIGAGVSGWLWYHFRRRGSRPQGTVLPFPSMDPKED